MLDYACHSLKNVQKCPLRVFEIFESSQNRLYKNHLKNLYAILINLRVIISFRGNTN